MYFVRVQINTAYMYFPIKMVYLI